VTVQEKPQEQTPLPTVNEIRVGGSITGHAEANADVYISQTEGFGSYKTIRTDANGNFKWDSIPYTVNAGDKLYFTSKTDGKTESGKVAVTVQEKPQEQTPLPTVNEIRVGGSITGHAEANADVYISQTEGFGSYKTIRTDADGNFKWDSIPYTVNAGDKLYFTSKTDGKTESGKVA
ncbi:hypothetical protein, partial [Enterococcus faecalis]